MRIIKFILLVFVILTCVLLVIVGPMAPIAIQINIIYIIVVISFFQKLIEDVYK